MKSLSNGEVVPIEEGKENGTAKNKVWNNRI